MTAQVIDINRARKRRAEQCEGCSRLITSKQLCCLFKDSKGKLRLFCSAACCELRRRAK